MTERPQPERPVPPTGRPPRRSRLAERSLLRNPLPAIAAAITIFLVVLALMIARLTTGADPGLHPAAVAHVSVVERGHRRTVLRTTASGRTILTTEGAAGGSSATGASAAPLTTRTSGGGQRDD